MYVHFQLLGTTAFLHFYPIHSMSLMQCPMMQPLHPHEKIAIAVIYIYDIYQTSGASPRFTFRCLSGTAPCHATFRLSIISYVLPIPDSDTIHPPSVSLNQTPLPLDAATYIFPFAVQSLTIHVSGHFVYGKLGDFHQTLKIQTSPRITNDRESYISSCIDYSPSSRSLSNPSRCLNGVPSALVLL